MRVLHMHNLRCPNPDCRRPVPLRIFPELAELAATLAPETRLQTFQCRCGRIFDICADHIQRAA